MSFESRRPYPPRDPVARDAAEPVSPPAIARTELEKKRWEASGRDALMMEVLNMVAVVMREQLAKCRCVRGEEVVSPDDDEL